MSFTLTKDHVHSLATPAKEGDLMPWIGGCDENIKWRIGASDEMGKGRTGVYVSLDEKDGGLADGEWRGC